MNTTVLPTAPIAQQPIAAPAAPIAQHSTPSITTPAATRGIVTIVSPDSLQQPAAAIASPTHTTIADPSEAGVSRLADVQRRAQSLRKRIGLPPHEMEVKQAAGALRLVGPKIESQPDESVRRLFGVRVADGRALFVQPITLGQVVAIAGSFNNWSAESHVLRRNDTLGVHEISLQVPPGIHRYRLVIDGHWTHDEHNTRRESNEFGGYNSVFIAAGVVSSA